jgi:hypothetical protein
MNTAKLRHPRIGVPRVYDGASIPILYPGEVARAHVDPTAVLAALQAGATEVPVREWTVEAAPGWHARWLRVRYRCWGRWFSRGAPKLTATATVDRGTSQSPLRESSQR